MFADYRGRFILTPELSILVVTIKWEDLNNNNNPYNYGYN